MFGRRIFFGAVYILFFFFALVVFADDIAKETNSSREKPWIVFERYKGIDSTGDYDGKFAPGESIDFPAVVPHVVFDTTTGALRTVNSYVTNTNSIAETSSIREMSWIVFEYCEIIDSTGDDDEIIDPGESIELPIAVRNIGGNTAYSLTGTLRTTDPYITMTDSIEEFGDVLPGSVSRCLDAFRFDVADSCPSSRLIDFELVTTDAEEHISTNYFSIFVLSGDIFISVDTLNFETAFIGYSDTMEFQVINIGSSILEVNDILSDNPDYSVNITSFSLLSGQSREVKVIFTPIALGTSTGSLTVQSDISDTSIVFLQGEGLYPPDISVSPDSLIDSLLVGETSNFSLTLYNTGGSDLDFYFSLAGADSNASDALGYALKFDGDNDYVEVPDHYSLSAIGGAFTLEFWMKVEEYPFKNREVLGKWGSGNEIDDEYDIDFLSTGEIQPVISGSNGLTKISSNPISSYTWIHVAEVFDAKNASYKLFINGILESSITPTTLSMNRNTTQPFRMGTYDFSWYPNFKGQLEEVRVWKVARTQANIQTNMYRGLSGSEPGLVGYWKFDEVSGNTSYDFSPNNNDGKLLGGVRRVVSPFPVMWLSVDTISGTVPADNSVNIEVTLDARGLIGGDYDAYIVIFSNDPDESEVRIPVHLHVTGIPDISVFEDTLDCGTVFTGYSSTDTLIVYNEGTDSLTISNISSDNSDFVVNVTEFSLAPGENQEVVVAFTPSTTGAITGILTVTSNDPDESTLEVYLEGECIEPPDISVSPDSLSDSLLAGEASTHILKIYNTGFSDLNFDILIKEVEKELFEALFSVKEHISFVDIDRQVPLVEIKKGEEDTRVYPPTVSGKGGPDEFSYHWKDSDEADGPTFDWIDVSGGTSISLSDDGFKTGIPFGFTFNYYGTDYTTIGAGSNGWLSFNGSNSGYPRNVPYVDYYDGAIAPFARDLYPPSASYIRYRTFGTTPTRYFVVEYNDIPDYGGSNRKTFEIIFYETYNKIKFQYLIAPNDPVGFGIESPDESMGMGNAGLDSLFVSPAVVKNNYVIEFSPVPDWIKLLPISGIVPAEDSIDIELTFNATHSNDGDYFADIVIFSNDSDESEVTVSAHLHVTGIPDIVVSEDSLNLGTLFVGLSVTDTLIITNEGTDSLTVSNISSNNSDFSVNMTNFDLNPEDSQEVVITFTPSATGVITGTLTIESDDPDEPVVTVFLQGEGTAPPVIAVKPDYFSDTLTTGESSVHILIIDNTGGNNLVFEITDESIEGIGQLIALNKNQITLGVEQQSESADLLNRPVENQSAGKEFQSDKTKVNLSDAAGASYAGDYLQFSISDYGEIISFQYPAGNEHLYVGNYLSGYTVCYNDGGDKVEWAGYETRSGIASVSYNEVINDVDSAIIAVVTQTSRGELTITQQFTFNKHDKFVRIETNIENTSVNTLNNIVFKRWADWDMDGSYYYDNWNYDLTHNMIYAWDEHYGTIAAKTPPDYRDIEGWDDYNRRITDEDFIEGPLTYFDGLEILHYELGNLPYGEGKVLTFAYGAADDLRELKSVIERGIAGVERFTAIPDTGTVLIGDSAEIEVRFNAASLYDGDYYANLLISSNDPTTPLDTVLCLLHVIGAPIISASSDTLKFSADSTDTLELKVRNKGTDDLLVTDISSDNSDYSVNITNFVLTPDGSQTVKVIFTPRAGGESNGNLTVRSNDPYEGTYTVRLIGKAPSGIEENIPKVFSISPSYPNPFSRETVIKYGCPKKAKVSIEVFNIMGQLVKTLVNQEMDAGYYEVRWDGSNQSGRKVASSVYFYRMQAGDFEATKKMVFAK